MSGAQFVGDEMFFRALEDDVQPVVASQPSTTQQMPAGTKRPSRPRAIASMEMPRA
jgi:hypothetical protein